jgi:hypothetical protein
MFRFAKDGCVRWPVSVQQVQEDGTAAEQVFVVTYQRLTRDELKEREAQVAQYLEQVRGLLPSADSDDTADMRAQRAVLADARTTLDDALLRERVKGWSGVADQDGTALAFSPALLDAFLDDTLLRNSLLLGLVNASAGAASKNSLPGLAGLPVPAQA